MQKLDEPENDDAAFVANHARERQHWNNDDYVVCSGILFASANTSLDQLLRLHATEILEKRSFVEVKLHL